MSAASMFPLRAAVARCAAAATLIILNKRHTAKSARQRSVGPSLNYAPLLAARKNAPPTRRALNDFFARLARPARISNASAAFPPKNETSGTIFRNAILWARVARKF